MAPESSLCCENLKRGGVQPGTPPSLLIYYHSNRARSTFSVKYQKIEALNIDLDSAEIRAGLRCLQESRRDSGEGGGVAGKRWGPVTCVPGSARGAGCRLSGRPFRDGEGPIFPQCLTV